VYQDKCESFGNQLIRNSQQPSKMRNLRSPNSAYRILSWLLLLVFITYIIVSIRLSMVEYSCQTSCPTFQTQPYDLDNKQLPRSSQTPDVKQDFKEDIREDVIENEEFAQPPGEEFARGESPHEKRLLPDLAPNTVHYIWCGLRWFEYSHYLSVKSVIKYIQPDRIMFHIEHWPRMDRKRYNQWFDEIRETFPFFTVIREASDGSVCAPDNKVKFMLQTLNNGGIVVGDDTVFVDFPLKFRKFKVINALNKTGSGYALAQRNIMTTMIDLTLNSKPLTGDISLETLGAPSEDPSGIAVSRCTTRDEYTSSNNPNIHCINLNGESWNPRDIWARDDKIGRLFRTIYYGKPNIPKPNKSYDNLVPNIAHLVWLEGGRMDFLFYLGVLSLLYVVEVDYVYIHGNHEPTGAYWQKIKDHERLKFIYRERPNTIYKNDVNELSHVTDLFRVDIMIKYGGIYVDTDTCFVRPLDREIRSYDAVASYDWIDWDLPYPDTINFGVTLGKRNAKYWHLFQESMKDYVDKEWSYNALRLPYKVQERHPELINLDPHLQVICFQFKCHPTWYPNYHNASIHHENTNSIKNWRNDTYAFHWTLPTPPELRSMEAAVQSKTIFAEIAQFVLKKAGLLK
ncbi:unnamed protein product, partial [Owenia fusiformis]